MSLTLSLTLDKIFNEKKGQNITNTCLLWLLEYVHVTLNSFKSPSVMKVAYVQDIEQEMCLVHVFTYSGITGEPGKCLFSNFGVNLQIQVLA